MSEKVTNELGGVQSRVDARFDCLPPAAMKLVAECFGYGAAKYGEDNWRKITVKEHLNHAANHVNEHHRGDTSEMHLVNNAVRSLMALEQAVAAGLVAPDYWHPEAIAQQSSGNPPRPTTSQMPTTA